MDRAITEVNELPANEVAEGLDVLNSTWSLGCGPYSSVGCKSRLDGLPSLHEEPFTYPCLGQSDNAGV